MVASRDISADISSDPDEAALQWLLRLREGARGPDAPRLQAAFSRWLQASAGHRQAYERRVDEWNALEPLAGAYRRFRPPSVAPARRRWMAGGLAAAGAACAGAIAWRLLVSDDGDAFQRSAHAAPGHPETLELPDGSRIALDSGARLDVAYRPGKRSVALHAGAAFFQVARDPDRPFVIDAGLGDIRVLGTSFEVDRGETAVTVSVLEGSVDVRDRAGGRTTLVAGQGVEVSRVALGPVRAVAPDRVASWRSGRLVFENVPLEEVAASLTRRGLARVRVAPEAAGLPVTFAMRTDDVDNALQALGDVLPVRLERRAGGILIVRR